MKAKNVVENIPIQELSSTMDVQNTITTADTIAKIVEKYFIELPDVANAQTQTQYLTFRELQGLYRFLIFALFIT